MQPGRVFDRAASCRSTECAFFWSWVGKLVARGQVDAAVMLPVIVPVVLALKELQVTRKPPAPGVLCCVSEHITSGC